MLRELAKDSAIPAGSKFETFAAADRVLGLDLVSLVGRPRPAAVLPAGAQQGWMSGPMPALRKDFASSDRLRAELDELGVLVADTPDGQTWTLAGGLADFAGYPERPLVRVRGAIDRCPEFDYATDRRPCA